MIIIIQRAFNAEKRSLEQQSVANIASSKIHTVWPPDKNDASSRIHHFVQILSFNVGTYVSQTLLFQPFCLDKYFCPKITEKNL